MSKSDWDADAEARLRLADGVLMNRISVVMAKDIRAALGEIERLRAGIAQDTVAWREEQRRTEDRVHTLEEALKVARTYVRSVELTIETQPNVVSADMAMIDAALREEGWGYDTETGEEGKP